MDKNSAVMKSFFIHREEMTTGYYNMLLQAINYS
jgi:hypothetical protein